MRLYKNRKFQTFAIGALLFFTVMMFFRLGFHHNGPNGTGAISVGPAAGQTPGETWMNIFQNKIKIGYVHRRLATRNGGYLIDEKTVMHINTMGLSQEILVTSSSTTDSDFAMELFDFSLVSGSFDFTVNGEIRDNTLYIRTAPSTHGGDPLSISGEKSAPHTTEIALENRIYLTSGLLPATVASGLEPGNEMTLFLFDPSTMAQAPATVTMVGRESVSVDGQTIPASRITLSFKGMQQVAWVDAKGQVLKEQGLLGITLVKTGREGALGDIAPEGLADVTDLVSVPSNVKFRETQRLTALQLRVTGVDTDKISLKAEGTSRTRQSWNGEMVTIRKESLDRLPSTLTDQDTAAVDERFKLPGPFIQSDDAELRRIAGKIISTARTPLEKVNALMAWIHDNIRRQPVISLPNALSTLKNRRGDCNEHAALMAALCRAVGIPAAVEAGLVYLKGSFYYHAWNSVFMGRWITVDALFDQIPCDVTHLSFTAGSVESQLNLMGIMGRIKLEVVKIER